MRRFLIPCPLLLALVLTANAQEKSVKPGINEPFKNPDVAFFQKTFEGESREVFVQREKIVAACGVIPGMVVADIGAGTGLHARLFARAVGDDGRNCCWRSGRRCGTPDPRTGNCRRCGNGCVSAG
jgi:hypothetical protein